MKRLGVGWGFEVLQGSLFDDGECGEFEFGSKGGFPKLKGGVKMVVDSENRTIFGV